jgi:hypothetical protein
MSGRSFIRVRYLTLVVAAAAALAAGVLVGSAASADSAKPALALSRARPLTVHGKVFRAHERVRVVLHEFTGVTITHRARAGRQGGFTAAFGSVPMGRCGGFRITAVGSLGSRATLRRIPLPACMLA